MKFNLKNISILGLIALFFVSAIACCCLTDIVQAEESAPSCHQTTHDAESSQNTEDCDCDQSIAVIKNNNALNDTLLAFVIFTNVQQQSNQFFDSSPAVVTQAPLQYYDTAPLYIKHSVLRI